MSIKISVIICTHNPRPDYLMRVLEALKSQTLPKDQWELLLVDNASKERLAEKWDLGWHPGARHIRETEAGLTPARLRGINESQGELLVFVDDDNILSSDYLELALEIGIERLYLGAWGGQCIPEFEIVPPDWFVPFYGFLTISEFKTDRWSNYPLGTEHSLPCGAGMCIRKMVADSYVVNTNRNKVLRGLDRSGKLLLGGGDFDLAATAIDLNLGTGLFSSLKLVHIIPKARLQLEYLEELVAGARYSKVILFHHRGIKQNPMCRSEALFEWYKLTRTHPHARKLVRAMRRAENKAYRDLQNRV
jgi:glycosyltransferase involved in cell wall biosynthesis